MDYQNNIIPRRSNKKKNTFSHTYDDVFPRTYDNILSHAYGDTFPMRMATPSSYAWGKNGTSVSQKYRGIMGQIPPSQSNTTFKA
jgi:hypothetical protein